MALIVCQSGLVHGCHLPVEWTRPLYNVDHLRSHAAYRSIAQPLLTAIQWQTARRHSNIVDTWITINM